MGLKNSGTKIMYGRTELTYDGDGNPYVCLTPGGGLPPFYLTPEDAEALVWSIMGAITAARLTGGDESLLDFLLERQNR